MSSIIKVLKPDHIVLNVKDIEASLRFYTQVLGLRTERLEEFQAGKAPFPSLRMGEQLIDLFPLKMTTPQEHAADNQQRLNHFCLRITNDVPWDALLGFLKKNEVPIEGEVQRNWGAWGYGYSLYIRDPDGNVVELKQYA